MSLRLPITTYKGPAHPSTPSRPSLPPLLQPLLLLHAGYNVEHACAYRDSLHPRVSEQRAFQMPEHHPPELLLP